MRALLFLSLWLAGCGAGACGQIQPEYTPYMVEPHYMDPGLAPIVVDSVWRLEARGLPAVSLPRVVGWRDFAGTENPRTVGMCYLPQGDIYIAPRLADEKAYVRSVLIHELAHCMYGADHDPEPGHILSEFQPPNVERWSVEDWEIELDHLARYILETSEYVRILVRLKQEGEPPGRRPGEVPGGTE
jgi:hypothetical protein